jgi:ferredoxin
MNVEIDTILCKAYGNCTFEAPDFFEVSDATGKAKLLVDVIPDDRVDEIQSAAEACPTQAIRILN